MLKKMLVGVVLGMLVSSYAFAHHGHDCQIYVINGKITRVCN